ncbi:MAG: YraN family protein [Cyclobacteriaceae bacterium]|nr:YraN family protein [Cyclobacteriaceae bacterium]MCH8516813.1 YraN family protein [Cyclobacteriaceae bacterium]
MKQNHIEKGKQGESIALKFLEDKGYRCVRRNYRNRHYEIDIIVESERELRFIEVKWRVDDKNGFPEETISQKKIDCLISCAETYLDQHPTKKSNHFDLINIIGRGRNIQISWMKDAI